MTIVFFVGTLFFDQDKKIVRVVSLGVSHTVAKDFLHQDFNSGSHQHGCFLSNLQNNDPAFSLLRDDSEMMRPSD